MIGSIAHEGDVAGGGTPRLAAAVAAAPPWPPRHRRPRRRPGRAARRRPRRSRRRRAPGRATSPRIRPELALRLAGRRGVGDLSGVGHRGLPIVKVPVSAGGKPSITNQILSMRRRYPEPTKPAVGPSSRRSCRRTAVKQLQAFWEGLDPRRRLIAGLSVLAIVAAVFGISRVATEPSLAMLYSGLDSAAAGEVVAELEAEGVAFEVDGSVDPRRQRRARPHPDGARRQGAAGGRAGRLRESSTASRASAPPARCSTPPTGAPRRASSPAPSPARPTSAPRGSTSRTRCRSRSRAPPPARPR